MPLAFEFLALAAIWGASFLLTRLCSAEFGVWTTSFLRVLLAIPILMGLLVAQGGLADLRKHWGRILFVGIINSGLPFALYAFAVLHIDTGLAAILNATTPLWGALIAWVWLADRLTWSRLLGLALGFAGVAALAWETASFKPGASAAGWAVVACLTATLCYGLAGSYAKKYLSGVSPLASSAGSQIGASALLLAPGLAAWPAQIPSGEAWLALLVLSAVCTALAYTLYFRLIERAGAAKAMTVTFLIPVFGVSYGVLLLGEPITLRLMICGGIVILGTALATGIIKLDQRVKPA